MFCHEEIHLAVTNTMLTGAGSFHCQCAVDHSLIETARLGNFLGGLRVDHEDQVEVAVSDMPGERRRDRGLRQVALGLGDAFRQPRDRYAYIGRPTL